MTGMRLARAARMFESFVGFIVLTVAAICGLFPRTPPRAAIGQVLPFAPAPPARESNGVALLVAGPLVMIAGLLVIALPASSSDCHGSPVCGIDAVGKLVQLLVGGVLMIAGLLVLIVGAFRSGR